MEGAKNNEHTGGLGLEIMTVFHLFEYREASALIIVLPGLHRDWNGWPPRIAGAAVMCCSSIKNPRVETRGSIASVETHASPRAHCRRRPFLPPPSPAACDVTQETIAEVRRPMAAISNWSALRAIA
jgi:hypothetical protein